MNKVELKRKIKKIPQQPGVYFMRDEMGQVIYVGKANRLRTRLRSHFSDRNTSPMSQAMVAAVWDVDFIPLKSEEEALLLECQYIKELKPKFNISYRDDKGYPFLKVTLQEHFPRFLITRLKKPDGALYLGPYTDVAALRKTVETLTRIFRIRTCLASHPGKYEHKHCLYSKMAWCSAPCVEEISKDDYRASVQNACQILLGHSKELIHKIKNQMDDASRALEFEKAAQMRDRLNVLQEIMGSKVRFIQKFRRTSDHVVEEASELAKALGLDRAPQRIEAFDISNFSGKEAVGSMVHFYGGRPDKRFYRRFRIREVVGIDDFAMMREVVRRRYQRVKEEGGVFPDLILIDGGKGQLSSAYAALDQLGLSHIPMIGLAKRYEEIFSSFKHDSIILKPDSGALHLIQRVRDEAHRFAVTYHKKLRDRKLKESILDDISGVGPEKKKILIRSFGSIQAIKKASLEEIRSIKEISMSLALKVYDAFHSLKP